MSPGFKHREREVGNPFLRADQRAGSRHWGRGRCRNAFLAERGDAPAQLGRPLVQGVLVERRVLDVVLQALDDRPRGGPVGVADAEVDHVAPGGDRGLFLLVDLGEQVGRELLEPFGLHKRGGRHDESWGSCGPRRVGRRSRPKSLTESPCDFQDWPIPTQPAGCRSRLGNLLSRGNGVGGRGNGRVPPERHSSQTGAQVRRPGHPDQIAPESKITPRPEVWLSIFRTRDRTQIQSARPDPNSVRGTKANFKTRDQSQLQERVTKANLKTRDRTQLLKRDQSQLQERATKANFKARDRTQLQSARPKPTSKRATKANFKARDQSQLQNARPNPTSKRDRTQLQNARPKPTSKRATKANFKTRDRTQLQRARDQSQPQNARPNPTPGRPVGLVSRTCRIVKEHGE